MRTVGGAAWAVPILFSAVAATAALPSDTAVRWENIEVSTPPEGVDARSAADDVGRALEGQSAAIASCFDGVKESMDAPIRVRLTLERGGVTEASSLDAPLPACVADALKATKVEALAEIAPPILLTVDLRVTAPKSAEPASAVPVPAAGSEPSASAPSPQGSTDIAAPAGAAAAPAGDGAANQVTASAAPASEEPKKPWKAIAQLTQSLGAGTFVGDDFAATPYYGYAFSLRGSYKVHELLSLALRFDMDQQLTVTNRDGGTIPREFFFRDVRLSASSAGIYEDKEYTGVKLGVGFDTYIPVSKPSRAQEQVIAFRPRFDLSRSFENLGPGTLDLTYTFGLKKNFAPATRGVSQGEAASLVESCRQSNRTDSGDCLTSFANLSHYFLNDFSVAYTFLEDFTATIGLSIFSNVSFRTNESEVPVSLAAGEDIEPGHSPNADPSAANVAPLAVGTIELGYSVNSNIAVAFGLTTSQNPFIQSGSNPSALRFPWWDFRSTADNLSTVYLDASFTY